MFESPRAHSFPPPYNSVKSTAYAWELAKFNASRFKPARAAPDAIARTTAHEFYHAAIAKPSLTSEALAQEADKFAERVLKEMEAEAPRKRDQEWIRRYRQLQSRRK